MQLATDVKDKRIRVKVKDGEMVFPFESRGKKAVAKGVFNKVSLTIDQTRSYLKEQAEDNKATFDPASVKEPLQIYQVNAVGVMILDK